MNRQYLILGVCFIAAVALLTVWAQRPPTSVPEPFATLEPAPEEPVTRDPLAIPQEHLKQVVQRAAELDAEADAEVADPAELAKPAPPPSQVYYKVADKLATQRLSEVPHSLIGAWDNRPDDAEPGRHRTFVLIVEPGISDAELEGLARDADDLHRDADVLDVRIYDKEDAATDSRMVDGGGYAYSHLVAQVQRHKGLNVHSIRVRGRLLTP